jgi:hypothetical protein
MIKSLNTKKKTTTYGDGNQGLGFGQARKYWNQTQFKVVPYITGKI